MSRHGGDAGEEEEEDREKGGEAGVFIADPSITPLSVHERDEGKNYGARRCRDGEDSEQGHTAVFYITISTASCPRIG